ncbi:MAG: hypothetical protein NPINA01_33470 [Nitrospinaceae bacterium]|nr:MAG: hypothetical protein NPINA01_33470 [Nitrospinaceae bacterium]
MLLFFTGTPGAGKSQFMIDKVVNDEFFKNRPVYYWGIPELSDSLGWHRIGDDTFDKEAAKKWHEIVEDGAVLIVDEAHQVWPLLKPGSPEPEWYSPLGTIRHRGITVLAATQYPTHVATSYRGRVERHYHLERKLGLERTHVLEWERYAYPSDKAERELTLSKFYYKFKPEIWKLYKSATVHTVQKRKLPKKVFIIPIALIIMIAAPIAVWRNLASFNDRAEVDTERRIAEATGHEPGQTNFISNTKEMTLTEYTHTRLPRIDNQPWTAPVYDEIRKPVSYPRPQCVEGKNKQGELVCICYSQQASRMQIDDELCKGIVRLGYFDPAVPDQYLTVQEQPYIRPTPPQRQEATVFIANDSSKRFEPSIDTQALNRRIREFRQ